MWCRARLLLSHIFRSKVCCSTMTMENGKIKNAKIWKPEQFLTPDKSGSYALVILNRALLHDPAFLALLWKEAVVKVTVDGGADRWLHLLTEHKKLLKSVGLAPPDLITGDFDSVKGGTLSFFKEQGSQIKHTPDQNLTDFTKALMELSVYCKNKSIKLKAILVLCHSTGRLDQIMANINTLYTFKKLNKYPEDLPIYLMAKNSITWLLEAGYHDIVIPEILQKPPNNWCSLIPVGKRCQCITTTGLKWNLDNHSLEFGELISTSNTYDGSNVVTVNNSHPLLWSMGLNFDNKP